MSLIKKNHSYYSLKLFRITFKSKLLQSGGDLETFIFKPQSLYLLYFVSVPSAMWKSRYSASHFLKIITSIIHDGPFLSIMAVSRGYTLSHSSASNGTCVSVFFYHIITPIYNVYLSKFYKISSQILQNNQKFCPP